MPIERYLCFIAVALSALQSAWMWKLGRVRTGSGADESWEWARFCIVWFFSFSVFFSLIGVLQIAGNHQSFEFFIASHDHFNLSVLLSRIVLISFWMWFIVWICYLGGAEILAAKPGRWFSRIPFLSDPPTATTIKGQVVVIVILAAAIMVTMHFVFPENLDIKIQT
jgi:hypothetical protein